MVQHIQRKNYKNKKLGYSYTSIKKTDQSEGPFLGKSDVAQP